MEKFNQYTESKIAQLNAQAAALQVEGKADEANFCKVRANIYDVCATVCKVHMNRPGGGKAACEKLLTKFQNDWGAELERARKNNDTKKICVEEAKMEALLDAIAHFNEVE